MIVTRDIAQEDVILQRLERILDNPARDKEEHVSDALWCQRKPILRQLDPQRLSRRSIVTFLIGRAQHDLLQALSDGEAEVRVTHGQKDGGVLIGTMDLVEAPIGVVEIKGTRASLKKFEEDGVETAGPWYIEQLKSYCGMKWVEWTSESRHNQQYYLNCYLVVAFINGAYGRSGPDLRVWKLTFTPEELEEWVDEIDARTEAMRTHKAHLAHLKGNPEAIKAAIQDGQFPQGPAYSFECQGWGCPWAKLCWPDGVPVGKGKKNDEGAA